MVPTRAALIAVALAWPAASQAGTVRFDFETGDLQGWTVVEGEFGKLLSDRAAFHNAPKTPYNKQGKFYLSTVEQLVSWSNDKMTGVVESPVFVLAAPGMTMLVGGGSYPGTYVALCTLDGAEVLQARGQRTEVMARVTWHAPRLVGKQVFLRLVDREQRGWGHITFDDFTATGQIDQAATRGRAAAREQKRLERERLRLIGAVEPLRLAIADLIATFPARYPRGGEFLARLDRLGRDVAASTLEQFAGLREEFEALQREALVANPLVSGQPILFVVRNQYKLGGHHAIDNLFHTGEINTNRFQGGGAMKTIDLANGGLVTTLVDCPKGIVRDPEVHFSGGKIVFALRRHVGEDYHLFEIHADGSGLNQLTCAEGVCDFDPLYLHDDSIVFSSTREPKYNQCSRDIAANLFRMGPDGANIHQITRNNLFDNHAALMPDGRILYERWEYLDRNFGDAHGLWTVNPDGTNQAVYWGNNTASPAAVNDPRILPGTGRVLCVFGPHHWRPWGALAIVDRRRGIDGREPVVRIWPPESIERVRAGGPFDCDLFAWVYPKYEDPYPLSDKYFLCSRMTLGGEKTWVEQDAKHGHQMGIYLVDVFGNEVLLHVEEPGCYDPMPLGPRPRPPAVPSRRDFEDGHGLLYVLDVCEGTHMRGVERGAVKHLRVVEAPEKRHWSRGSWNGQGYTAPGMNWHSLENKRILGTVPVEPDGSACFALPADTFVYFQLLDANGMMIQSMRSGTVVQSGERTGCVGCHESRLASPPAAGRTPMALRRPPSKLNGWYGPPRPFDYMTEVQPVLDRHCVRCHDYGGKGSAKLVLAADRTIPFNTSYTELWRKRAVTCVGGGPAEIQQAYSWGSHPSKLVGALRKGHNDVKLSREELDRIITWVDLNAPYYGRYASAYPDHLTGRCPLDHRQIERLSQLTGVPFAKLRSYARNRGPQVSFDRPELSPCLAQLKDRDDPRYKEALGIIQAGKAMLAKRPRADMPGFQPCEVDRRREAKYALRRQIEARNRKAIREGRRAYDRGEENEPPEGGTPNR